MEKLCCPIPRPLKQPVVGQADADGAVVRMQTAAGGVIGIGEVRAPSLLCKITVCK
jgi:hypothetical protein